MSRELYSGSTHSSPAPCGSAITDRSAPTTLCVRESLLLELLPAATAGAWRLVPLRVQIYGPTVLTVLAGGNSSSMRAALLLAVQLQVLELEHLRLLISDHPLEVSTPRAELRSLALERSQPRDVLPVRVRSKSNRTAMHAAWAGMAHG